MFPNFFLICQDWARKQIVKDIRKRLDSAGARRAAHMQQIVAKANDENIKVDEVIFINRWYRKQYRIWTDRSSRVRVRVSRL